MPRSCRKRLTLAFRGCYDRAAFRLGFPARRRGVATNRNTIEEERPMAVNVGDMAPDFELPACVGEEKTRFRLSDYRGKKHVVVVFYPADWTPV